MKHKVASLLVAGSLACGTVVGFALASGTAAQGSIVRYKVITKSFSVPANQTSQLQDVKCPRGMVPVGGGAHFGSPSNWTGGSLTVAGVTESDIDSSHHGWEVSVFNQEGFQITMTANAVCAVL
jgi:hypothetical protein